MASSQPGETKVIKSACILCFLACGIDAYVRDGRLVKVEGTAENPLNKGWLCPKGEHLPDYVYSPDRLKYPMKKAGGDWKRISWDEALDTIAGKLQQIKDEYGARALAVITGSIGAEDIELSGFAQRFRGAYGTPNFLSVESICFRSRIMARVMTFGTYPLEDPEKSKCIILWGHNPDNSEGTIANRIYKALDNGSELIVIDPRRIPLAKRGLHLQIRPGTDCALALAMMNVIIAEDLYDKEFVEKYTAGFDKLVEHVKQYSPEKVEEITWVPASDIRRAAQTFAGAESGCIIQGINCLDQHVNGFQTNRVLAILQTITGNYDVPGGWATNPFMRLTDLRLPVDEEPIGAEQYPVFRGFWGMTSPYGQALTLPDVILSEKPYPIKAIIVTGGNPAVSWPDSKKVEQAFKKVDLVVVIDVFMTQTAELADIVLPACSCVEKMGIVYNYALTSGIPYAMLRRKVIEPMWECWPDWKFYSELGRRMGYGEYFPWNTEEEIMENWLERSSITLKQLTEEHPEGIYFASRCYDINAKNQIRTPSGKIEIYSQTLADAGYDPIPVHKEPSQSTVSNPEIAKEYPLILVTGARAQPFTHCQMRNIPQLRQLIPEPVAEIHPAAAEQYGIADADTVVLETRKGQIRIRVKTTEDIAPQVVSVPHGWAEANVNLLTSLGPNDPVTGYVELRALACRIKKV